MKAAFLFLLLAFPAVADAAISINTTVVDAQDFPLPGATVTLVRHASPIGSALGSVATDHSDTEGRCHFELEEPGVYSVQADLGGFLSSSAGPFFVSKATVEADHTLLVRLLLSLDGAFGLVSLSHQHLKKLEGLVAEPLAEEDLNDVREIILRHMLSLYERMRRETGVVPWDGYCVGFDGGRWQPEVAAPPVFLRRLGDQPGVRGLGRCEDRDERSLSVGPIEWSSPDLVLVWSSSSYGRTVRAGMYCLNLVARTAEGWQRDDDCLVQMRYN